MSVLKDVNKELSPRKVAIFDVCGTLYNANTSKEFIDWIDLKKNKKRHIVIHSWVTSKLNAIFYKLTGTDLIRWHYTYKLKGRQQNDINSLACKFVNNILSCKIYPEVHALLRKYQNEGIETILMSASYDILIYHVAKYFNISSFHASILEVTDDGVLTGKLKLDLLGIKHDLLESITNSEIKLIVVSDNKSDIALLRKADKSYIVCHNDKAERFWKNAKLNNKVIIRPT